MNQLSPLLLETLFKSNRSLSKPIFFSFNKYLYSNDWYFVEASISPLILADFFN